MLSGIPLSLPTPHIPDKGKGKCKLWKAHPQRSTSRSMQADLLVSGGLVGTRDLPGQALRTGACSLGPSSPGASQGAAGCGLEQGRRQPPSPL